MSSLTDIGMNFNSSDLVAMNAAIALMMFGVSLQLKKEDFSRLITEPKAPIAGLIAQFLLLPLATCLATWLFAVPAEFALGMILVASCPGGTFSNVMTWMAKGNVAVSVTMTAISSLAAVVMTPFNFAFYGWLNPNTRPLLQQISIDPVNLLLLVALVLALPIFLGMSAGKRFPAQSVKAEQPMRWLSLLLFFVFIAIALQKNFDLFIQHVGAIFLLVIAHNAIAFLVGHAAGLLARLPRADRRAVTMEVGIQNSGLGLMILFTFFPLAGGMILITAMWGVWHLISGLTLAQIWARRPL
ncbi:MAG: bile acid:sodium symporter family protein [Alcanivoracaceae bacterium]|jgi:BASS family bile acid:Na+ symporter|nr:bile acid:sodium symporter family protein [Alcanivoracaceae bacterium]